MAGGSHQDSHENLSPQAVLTEVWVAPFIVSAEGSVGCLPLSPGDTLSLDRTLQTPCLTSSPHTCDLHLELKKLLFFMNPSLRYSAMVTESSKEAHQGLASPTRCHQTPPPRSTSCHTCSSVPSTPEFPPRGLCSLLSPGTHCPLSLVAALSGSPGCLVPLILGTLLPLCLTLSFP